MRKLGMHLTTAVMTWTVVACVATQPSVEGTGSEDQEAMRRRLEYLYPSESLRDSISLEVSAHFSVPANNAVTPLLASP